MNLTNAEDENPINTDDSRPKKYIILRSLGKGSFGRVKEALHVFSGERIAIKILEKSRIKKQDDLRRIRREIDILNKVNHPNIIQLYEIIETNKYFFFVMEYAKVGEQSNFIEKKNRLSELEACKLFQQLISGIEYLHSLGCAHRDIKPSNILLDEDNNLKIIDFGLGNMYDTDEKLKTACGSPCYAAPEIISGEEYNPLQVDIWSAGITLYCMVAGAQPFDEETKTLLYQKILACEYPVPKWFSPICLDLIRRILVRNPQERLSLEDIKNHSWFGMYEPIQLHPGIIPGIHSFKINTYIAKVSAKKMNIELQDLRKMLVENDHNKYTTLYWLILKKVSRGGFDIPDEQEEVMGGNTRDNNRVEENRLSVDKFMKKRNMSAENGNNFQKTLQRQPIGGANDAPTTIKKIEGDEKVTATIKKRDTADRTCNKTDRVEMVSVDRKKMLIEPLVQNQVESKARGSKSLDTKKSGVKNSGGSQQPQRKLLVLDAEIDQSKKIEDFDCGRGKNNNNNQYITHPGNMKDLMNNVYMNRQEVSDTLGNNNTPFNYGEKLEVVTKGDHKISKTLDADDYRKKNKKSPSLDTNYYKNPNSRLHSQKSNQRKRDSGNNMTFNNTTNEKILEKKANMSLLIEDQKKQTQNTAGIYPPKNIKHCMLPGGTNKGDNSGVGNMNLGGNSAKNAIIDGFAQNLTGTRQMKVDQSQTTDRERRRVRHDINMTRTMGTQHNDKYGNKTYIPKSPMQTSPRSRGINNDNKIGFKSQKRQMLMNQQNQPQLQVNPGKRVNSKDSSSGLEKSMEYHYPNSQRDRRYSINANKGLNTNKSTINETISPQINSKDTPAMPKLSRGKSPRDKTSSGGEDFNQYGNNEAKNLLFEQLFAANVTTMKTTTSTTVYHHQVYGANTPNSNVFNFGENTKNHVHPSSQYGGRCNRSTSRKDKNSTDRVLNHQNPIDHSSNVSPMNSTRSNHNHSKGGQNSSQIRYTGVGSKRKENSIHNNASEVNSKVNRINLNLSILGANLNNNNKNVAIGREGNKAMIHSRDNSAVSYNNAKNLKAYIGEKNSDFLNKMNKAPSNQTNALKKIAYKTSGHSKERKPNKNSVNSVDKRQLEAPTNKTMYLAKDSSMVDNIFKSDMNNSIDQRRKHNLPGKTPIGIRTDTTQNNEFQIKDGLDLAREKFRSKREISGYRKKERVGGQNCGDLSQDENGKRGNSIKISKNDVDPNNYSNNSYFYH